VTEFGQGAPRRSVARYHAPVPPAAPAALTVDDLTARVTQERARAASRLWPRCAVAMILRQQERAEVLLMQRALRAGDRWSGHVALPGGREDLSDVDLLATAIRETAEEVGIDLKTSARLVGRLAPVWTLARGGLLPMSITPFVFCVAGPIELVLGDEATAAFWFPVGAAAAGALDGVHVQRLGPIEWKLLCWQHEGRVVWGLTFTMLRRLLALAG
jgi:8-oxo-dGTP pyrophosphatase MutT (NUDIX family)